MERAPHILLAWPFPNQEAEEMPTLYTTKKPLRLGAFYLLGLFLFLFLNVILGILATESSGVVSNNANF